MLDIQITDANNTEGSNNNKQSCSEKASFSSMESVYYDLMEDSLNEDRENMCEKLYKSLCSEGNLSDEGYINADKSEGSEGIQSGEVRTPNDRQMTAVEEPGNARFSSGVLPTIQEKRSMSTSPIILPEIDVIQIDDSLASNNDSPQFNDTLDEINRLMELTDFLVKSNSEHLFTPSNTASGSCSHIPVSTDKQGPFKTPTNVTPSWEKKQHLRSNIKKTPDNNFKVPQKPVRLKFTEPTPPRCAPAHLKNVVSPVALYIKNSPSFPLKQNVPQKELLKIVTSKIPKPAMKENLAELPEVVYKPSTKQINSREKDIVLPPSIKRLNVKEPRITKHEGRIHQSASSKGLAGRKLLSNDITNA
ncbi:hypothetical protein NQ317_004847 [Molorchus minor]|uniref:Uncharacterized protein n=1 Tax=Molorchus minor TaxID=1323400 RepID=A0ABQ9J7K6_9CUCU|nr:hypothetical protein NQ317_004847 [Molorchus minor]